MANLPSFRTRLCLPSRMARDNPSPTRGLTSVTMNNNNNSNTNLSFGRRRSRIPTAAAVMAALPSNSSSSSGGSNRQHEQQQNSSSHRNICFARNDRVMITSGTYIGESGIITEDQPRIRSKVCIQLDNNPAVSIILKPSLVRPIDDSTRGLHPFVGSTATPEPVELIRTLTPDTNNNSQVIVDDVDPHLVTDDEEDDDNNDDGDDGAIANNRNVSNSRDDGSPDDILYQLHGLARVSLRPPSTSSSSRHFPLHTNTGSASIIQELGNHANSPSHLLFDRHLPSQQLQQRRQLRSYNSTPIRTSLFAGSARTSSSSPFDPDFFEREIQAERDRNTVRNNGTILQRRQHRQQQQNRQRLNQGTQRSSVPLSPSPSPSSSSLSPYQRMSQILYQRREDLLMSREIRDQLVQRRPNNDNRNHRRSPDSPATLADAAIRTDDDTVNPLLPGQSNTNVLPTVVTSEEEESEEDEIENSRSSSDHNDYHDDEDGNNDNDFFYPLHVSLMDTYLGRLHQIHHLRNMYEQYQQEEEEDTDFTPTLNTLSQEQIDLFPCRTLDNVNDLLLSLHEQQQLEQTATPVSSPESTTPNTDLQQCTICLENYKLNDAVRTIPCFHTFHIDCIDPWLLNCKSECPLCKHPVSSCT